MNTQANEPLQDTKVIDGEIIEVKTPAAALAVLNPGEYGKQLMEPFAKQLTLARRKVGREKFDITTKEGMATAKALRKLFVTIRTDADAAKSEAKRPIDAAGKAILAEFKPIEEGAKAEEAKIAAVIAAEEKRIADEKAAAIAAERARIEAIEARLAHIRSLPSSMQMADSTAIQGKIDALLAKQLDPALYDEFLDEAAEAMIETVDQLRAHLQAALDREEAARKAEETARELQRMKDEQAERERKEREAQAERDRQAEEARKAQAERERQFAEQQAAVQRQQQQMSEIMAMNTLASTAPTIELHGELERQLAKVQAFDPASYGDMAPMATMARDMALQALQARYAQLPDPYIAPVPAAVEEAPAAAEPTAQYVDQDAPDVITPAAIDNLTETLEANRQAPRRPELVEVVNVLAKHYQVEKLTVLAWMMDWNVEAIAVMEE